MGFKWGERDEYPSQIRVKSQVVLSVLIDSLYLDSTHISFKQFEVVLHLQSHNSDISGFGKTGCGRERLRQLIQQLRPAGIDITRHCYAGGEGSA